MVNISYTWMQTFEMYFSMWCFESEIFWEESLVCKNSFKPPGGLGRSQGKPGHQCTQCSVWNILCHVSSTVSQKIILLFKLRFYTKKKKKGTHLEYERKLKTLKKLVKNLKHNIQPRISNKISSLLLQL